MNKKGWIKVLEVFVSIILVVGVVVLLLNRTYFNENVSEEISAMENSILEIVRINESLRGEILDASLPTNWSDFNSSLPEVRKFILSEKYPSYDCQAKICSLEDSCVLEEDLIRSIYASSMVVSSDYNTYSPRQLKLFCWEKQSL